MATCDIRGISVKFPFEPYELQKNYMEKVIDCILNRSNGVLESPTGTGKTLSLLCSSLAWLEIKKAQLQLERQKKRFFDGNDVDGNNAENSYLETLQQEIGNKSGSTSVTDLLNNLIGMPTIIYASRTHSQLSQAMQELKRTAYSYMKSTVLGSREQLCVHPDVRKQSHALQIHMCRLKVKTRSCNFYNRVDKFKDNPEVFNKTVLDIEDLVKTGETYKFCPYFMSKSLKNNADIVFMPYNYLLDPKARKALGIELANNVVILDEAHNIEKMCEDSASIQIKSTDITLCIEEITTVMKATSENIDLCDDFEIPKDFTADELCVLKEMFLDFEKELDRVELKTTPEGTTFDGDFIFELLTKAGINDGNYNSVRNIIEKIIQFLSTASSSDGPFQRKGNSLQLISDLLTVAFASVSPDFRTKIKKCYKVHITVEESKKKSANNWLTKATKPGCRVLSYWCFSPGFGMNLLMNQGVHCVILTSGTLAPLKPLISELELNIGVRLENPHIVKDDQICVRIVSQGPDMETLNCNYQNRDNPKYIQSLGRTILNLTRIIPDGILIFFPSYPIMQKFQQLWQESGIWGNINELKTIYVEPKDKTSFNTAMTDYYSTIKDPNSKGAIFMGVCRGKISEGVDFADINGRAVFVIGLPYPPLKDPRIILKKRYLDTCNSNDKEYLRGDDWYSLEASRAVNQAMGRIIRHKDDYGAIVLLDSRFNNQKIKSQMSVWLRDQIKSVKNFGEIIRDLSGFFRNVQKTKPPIETVDLTTDSSSSGVLTSDSDNDGLVAINKRPRQELLNPTKKLKITVVPNATPSTTPETSIKEFIVMVKKALEPDVFKQFLDTMASYRANTNFDELKQNLNTIFETRYNVRYIIPGLEPYIKEDHKTEFTTYCESMK